jgi:endonuclease VIII-like 1
MPELAEVALTADYINTKAAGKKFIRVRKNPSHKGKILEFPEEFEISSRSRGKELKLFLSHSEGTESLLMTMGMSGHFRLTKTGEELKHSHLMFDSDDGTTLSFVDVRRFGKWSFGDWNPLRGPDPVQEHDLFIQNIQNNLEKKDFVKPLHEFLMNQKYFNGIGNYLRAEIVYRLEEVDPFLPALRILTSEFARPLLKLCKEIPERAYVLGGGNLYTWSTPEGLEIPDDLGTWDDFMICYGNPNMSSVVDSIGRRFWFDPKWKK